MAPLLLDQRRLIKTGLYLCLMIAVVFFSGYYSGFSAGYGHAESHAARNAPIPVALALPEPAYTDSGAFEPQPPAVIEPGADIDVDAPDAGPAVAARPALAGAEEFAERASAGGAVRLSEPAGPILQVASLDVTPDVIAGVNAASPLASNASPDEADYSIQTGMYGNLRNAEIRLESLGMSGLDAYIDEFTNAANQARFNVRFGFYRDRASARAALQVYEAQFAGEGYIVRVEH